MTVGGIRVRFATVDDEQAILDFLHSHWKHDHIFVTNPELMRWQHRSPLNPEAGLTFVVAEHTLCADSNPIIGLLGYIPFNRFDPEANWTELALAIWKVRDDAETPGLGIQVLKYLDRELAPSLICAIGISEVVKPIYKALGYHLGAMQQLALFPAIKSTETKIASGVPDSGRSIIPIGDSVELQPLEKTNLLNEDFTFQIDKLGQLSLPRKSCRYLRQRYSDHPWYEYRFHLIKIMSESRALVVSRQVSAAGSKILRIVDFLGDPEALCQSAGALQRMVESEGYEYLDVVAYGINQVRLREFGFVDAFNEPGLILPNYFSPFEKRNIRIDFAFKKSKDYVDKEVHLFRADSDQDRPNSQIDLY